MSSGNFIIAQILGLTATLILCLSYTVKNKKTFLLLSFFGETVYGLSFIFVNSLGTGLIALLSCLQSICFYFYDKKGIVMPKLIALIFATSFVLVGVSLMQTLWDLIPVILYVWFTFSLYQTEVKSIRIMYVIPNTILAVYDIVVMAYASAFEDGFEALFLLSVILIDLVKTQKIKNNKLKRATLTKQNSISKKFMGVKFNLRSAIFETETSDNQVSRKYISRRKFMHIPSFFLQYVRPKLPQH